MGLFNFSTIFISGNRGINYLLSDITIFLGHKSNAITGLIVENATENRTRDLLSPLNFWALFSS
jgi:hypothetical protein